MSCHTFHHRTSFHRRLVVTLRLVMQDVGVGVSFRLRWMTQTDIVDEIYDGREISTMFVIMAAAESITVVDCCMLLLPNQSHSYRQLYRQRQRQPAGKHCDACPAESYVCLSHRGV